MCGSAPVGTNPRRRWGETMRNRLGPVRRLARQAIDSDFVRQVGETFMTRVGLIGIGLVTSILVTRGLGPEGRGLYALAVTVGALGVQFGNFGLHASNTYFVARDRSALPVIVDTSLLVGLVFGSAGAGAAWALFSLRPALAPISGPLLLVALVWVPLGLTYLLLQNILLGVQEIRAYNVIEVTSRLVAVALLAAVILADRVNPVSAVSAGLGALAVGTASVLLRVRGSLAHPRIATRSEMAGYLRYGLKSYGASLLAYAVTRTDLFVIHALAGDRDTGLFSVASSLADNVYLIPTIIGSLLFPRLSAMTGLAEKRSLTRRTAAVSTLLTGGLALVLCGLARPLIVLLFGAGFAPAAPALRWLLAGAVVFPLMNATAQLLGALGNSVWYVVTWGAAFALKMLVSYYVVKHLGFAWAGLGNAFVWVFALGATKLIIGKGWYAEASHG